MANKHTLEPSVGDVLTLKDEKGRNINWKILKTCKISVTIPKGTKVYLCKNSNRYNLLWREK